MEKTKEHYPRILALCAVLLVLAVLNFILLNYARFLNKKYLHSQSTLEYTWNLTPPVEDSIYLPIFKRLEWKRYDWRSSYQSDLVETIYQRFPAIQKSCNGQNFASLEDLLAYLVANGWYQKEFQILEYYSTAEKSKTPGASTWGEDDLLRYVDEIYVEPIDYAVSGYEYKRAKWLVNEAYRRISLSHFDPLNVTLPSVNRRLNRVYLLKALLNSPSVCYQSSEECQKLYPYLNSAYKIVPVDTIAVFSNDSSFMTVKTYWKGVFLMRNEKFEEAQGVFDSLTVGTDPYMGNLASLMRSRCLTWNYLKQEPKGDKAAVISALRDIKRNEQVLNFQKDIDYYINYLSEYQEVCEDSATINPGN